MHQGPGSRFGEGGALVSMVTWNGLCFPGSAFGPGQWTEGLADGDRARGVGEAGVDSGRLNLGGGSASKGPWGPERDQAGRPRDRPTGGQSPKGRSRDLRTKTRGPKVMRTWGARFGFAGVI